MASSSFSVKVTGLRELARAFDQINDQLPDAMTEALMKIAARIAARARSKTFFRHGSGTAAGTIQPKAGSSSARIVAGGTAAPYFPWLDFGGTTGRGHKRGPGQGAIERVWMGKPSGMGRYIYPAVVEARGETYEALDGVIHDLAAKAEFEQRGKG